MNKIQLDSAYLKPATLAAMIADLLEYPHTNAIIIRSLITQLEDSVGSEESIDFLVDAGVYPEFIEKALG